MKQGLRDPKLTIQEIAELKRYARRQGDHQELKRLNGLLIEASRTACRELSDPMTDDVFTEIFERLEDLEDEMEDLEDEINSGDGPRAHLRATMREVWNAMEELRAKWEDSFYDRA